MSRKIEIGIIGFGNMGHSCAAALKAGNQYKIFIYDKDKKKTQKVKGFYLLQSTPQLIAAAGIVILAIKPQDIGEFLTQNKEHLLKKKPLIISIAAGISTSRLEKSLENLRVVRAMPNLAARVKKSISFLSGGKFAKKSDLEIAKKIFSCVGEVVVIKEKYLDKVTGVSGSGPGYVFYFMESMYQGALKLGFTKNNAKKMIIQTFLGAAKLAEEPGEEFKSLIAGVASQKGTTEAALKVFTALKVDKAIVKGMESACQRAGKISREFSGKKRG